MSIYTEGSRKDLAVERVAFFSNADKNSEGTPVLKLLPWQRVTLADHVQLYEPVDASGLLVTSTSDRHVTRFEFSSERDFTVRDANQTPIIGGQVGASLT